ncbi:hypothetical protein Tco_0850299 [Tanacetum coccineum]
MYFKVYAPGLMHLHDFDASSLTEMLRDLIFSRLRTICKDLERECLFVVLVILSYTCPSIDLIPLVDGIRQGLKARFVYGKTGTDINSILAYNPDVMEDEAGTSTNPASNSTSSANGVTQQFIIVLSVPYVRDTGANFKDVTPADEIVTVESDNVLAGTASNPAASEVHASGPSIMVIPTSSPFK